MIIQLKPPTPATPVVLFSFTFNSSPPAALPLPTAYNNQLQLLAQHDIQGPSSLHMLDKSVWLVTCLHEVIFDLSGNTGDDFVTIRCTFIDGDVRRNTWPPNGTYHPSARRNASSSSVVSSAISSYGHNSMIFTLRQVSATWCGHSPLS